MREILEQRLAGIRPSKPKTRKRITYLNKSDKKRIGMIAAMTVGLDESIAEWEDHAYPVQVIANAKRARTFLYGVMNQLMKEIPYEEREKIIRAVGGYRFEVNERG